MAIFDDEFADYFYDSLFSSFFNKKIENKKSKLDKKVKRSKFYRDLPPIIKPGKDTIWYEGMTDDYFLLNMNQYMDITCPISVNPIPVTAYRLNYINMSKEQLVFYLYFRTELQKFNLLRSFDTEYLELYIDELMNLAFGHSPQTALDTIIKISELLDFKSYRLIDIFFDAYYSLIVYFKLDFKILPSLSNYVPNEPLVLDYAITYLNEKEDGKLPFWILNLLSNSQITESRFYKDEETNFKFVEILYETFNRFNILFNKKNGKYVVDYYGPKRKRSKTLEPLKDYYLDPEIYPTLKVSLKNYSTNRELRGFMINFVKYVDNLYRKEQKVRGRLKVKELSDEDKKLIDLAFKHALNPKSNDKESNKPNLDFNLESINSLREDTKEVQKALLVEEEVDLNIEDLSLVFKQLTKNEINLLNDLLSNKEIDKKLVDHINQLSHQFFQLDLIINREEIEINEIFKDKLRSLISELPSDYFEQKKELVTDNEELNDLINDLEEKQINLLKDLRQNKSIDNLGSNGIFISQIIDDINELALTYIGDIIIEEENDNYIINPEYSEYFK